MLSLPLLLLLTLLPLFGALVYRHRAAMLVPGILIALLPAILGEIIWRVVPADLRLHRPAVGWLLLLVPVLASAGYFVFAIAGSWQRAKVPAAILVVLVCGVFYFIDSRLRVEFRDSRGRPVEGGIVEVVYSGFLRTDGPPYPTSGADGIAHIGLIRWFMVQAGASFHVHSGTVVDDDWPMKVVIR